MYYHNTSNIANNAQSDNREESVTHETGQYILEIPAFRWYAFIMCAVRLLAIDLDDTLLRSDLTISYRTRKAVKKAEAAGVTVVLASGRVPAAMEPYVKFLDMNRKPGYLICNNGTLIQETHAGNTIYPMYFQIPSFIIYFQ